MTGRNGPNGGSSDCSLGLVGQDSTYSHHHAILVIHPSRKGKEHRHGPRAHIHTLLDDAVFDETSLPTGLRHHHSTKAGVWDVIRIP
ncbi:DUF1971 domain-containing protein [Brevundimonas sp.]|uniref:DUF1971 domain-containing protein n=1 Tax=Brevundimonas sp. TaxID=1871086 RepID=UPI00356AC041